MTVDPDEGLIAAAECVDFNPAVGQYPEPGYQGNDADFAVAELPSQLRVDAAYHPQMSVNDGIIASDGTLEVVLLDGSVALIDSDTVAALLEAISETDDDSVQSALEQVLGSAGSDLVPVTAAACLLIPENTYLVTDAALAVDPDEGLIAAAECVDLTPSSGNQPEDSFEIGDPISATAELPSQLRASATE